MQVGRYNKRVMIQKPVETQQDNGEFFTVFEDFYECWASIEPLQGKELFQASQIQSVTDTRIRIRFNRDVNEKMRVMFVTEYASPNEFDLYNIDNVLFPKENRRETQLMCTKVSSQGFLQEGSNGESA